MIPAPTTPIVVRLLDMLRSFSQYNLDDQSAASFKCCTRPHITPARSLQLGRGFSGRNKDPRFDYRVEKTPQRTEDIPH